MKHSFILTGAFLILSVMLHFSAVAQLGSSRVTTVKVAQTNLKPLAVKKGTNVFSSMFNATATGRNDRNAYLLCYLATLIYPENLGIVSGTASEQSVARLHTDPPAFEAAFINETKYLFPGADFKFFNESDRLGYDPEAMVINTPSTVYIVFRGTDRVGTNKPGSILYGAAEWISSDFDARQISADNMTGKILSGMWSSLSHDGFKDKIYNYLLTKGAAAKKVWITGHSLGAGQAQLYAMFLSKKGIPVQGVYAYAAPHPGDRQFVNEMDRLFPNHRLQRFEFIDDPVAVMAPYTLGYERAGTRVYYNDIQTIEFNKPERSLLESSLLIPGIMSSLRDFGADKFINVNSSARLKLESLGSGMCFHHPAWYLRAAWQQLSAADQEKMPRPLANPVISSEGCDPVSIERTKTSNPLALTSNVVRGAIDAGVAAINSSVDEIQFSASSIISNVTGSAIQEGRYYILSHASGDMLGLNEQDGFFNESELRLTTNRSAVTISRQGTVGYVIEFGTRTVQGWFGSETRRYVLDSQAETLFQGESSLIQLYEKNNFGFNSNQRWLFISLGNNKYLIKNMANGKLLDANNACINDNSCGVKTYRPINNDRTQVWTLQRRN